MRFRPCIDLHQGKVKQIVGGTLDDQGAKENFTAEYNAAHFARMYRQDNLSGGHVIMLGPGNQDEAVSALKEYPGGLQIGGGITPGNARKYIDTGASAIIVTSSIFTDGELDFNKLKELTSAVPREQIVIDLSCRLREDNYIVVTDRWQTFSHYPVTEDNIRKLEEFAGEFLIHGVDVEGLCSGIEEELVIRLGEWVTIPCTYAGGVRSIDDLERIRILGKNKIDATVGSALDIFGGTLPYREVVEWHRTWAK